MEGQNPQLTPEKEGGGETERKPAIRTMKTDLAEMAKSPGVSVAEAISRELKEHPSEVKFGPRPGKKSWLVIGGVLLLILGGTAAYFFISGRSSQEATPAPQPPAPLFGVERSTVVTVRIQERLGFLRQTEAEVKDLKRAGTITGILLKVLDGPQERFASMRDFTELMGFNAPSGFSQQFESSDLMLFIYQGAERNHFGLAARAKDADRAFREMLLWEKTLPGDFLPFLFDETANVIGASFEDKTYRNIDYRFAKLSPAKDLGVGYTVFPARKVLVITTGQESIERVIDRLFDAK